MSETLITLDPGSFAWSTTCPGFEVGGNGTVEAAVHAHNAVVTELFGYLSKATEFRLSRDVYVSWRGETGWAVTDGAMVLNRSGEWEFESSARRTDKFLERTRFTLEDAFQRAKAALKD